MKDSCYIEIKPGVPRMTAQWPLRGVPGTLRQANLFRVAIRTPISIGWLFLSWQEFPKSLLWVMLFLEVVFLPLYIDTNHNDVGVMLILCNGQCPQLILV
jgi:hypothetical protein